jgi:hypothetical protein
MRTRRAQAARTGLELLLLGLLVCGCASSGMVGGARWEWFGVPDARDPWSPKIAGWQARELARLDGDGEPAPASVSGAAGAPGESAPREGTALLGKYLDFRAEQRRKAARDVARWIQRQAREHYIEDGPIDHWATFRETLARDGEDCDGLELLVHNVLRDLGFPRDELYRAIVYRPRDGQHHMVTLWFEDRDDPWVIDPTGAMVSGMPRMSEVPGWAPLKLFSEDAEYTVRPERPGVPAFAGLRSSPEPRR